MSATRAVHIVELTDETDDLIGYGVCVIYTDATTKRSTYLMRPDVHGTREQAHRAALITRDEPNA
jgi:hypothetical protein